MRYIAVRWISDMTVMRYEMNSETRELFPLSPDEKIVSKKLNTTDKYTRKEIELSDYSIDLKTFEELPQDTKSWTYTSALSSHSDSFI